MSRVLVLALVVAALVGAVGAVREPPLLSAPAWEQDRRATQDPTGAGQNETAVAANPLDADNAVVVTKDFRDGAAVRDYVDTTTDGGLTWLEQPFPLPNPAVPHFTDPAAFFRPDGRAYIVWTSSGDFQHGGLFIAWSTDKGITWSAPVAITPPAGHFDDKAWVAFDDTGGARDGAMYAAWTRFGKAEIYAARSTDGGATWSGPAPVSSGEWAINNDGAQPVVLPDGTLAVIFLHDTGAPDLGTLVMARSTDGGATFGPGSALLDVHKPPFTLPGENWRIFTYHSLARDPVRGWLTLVWPDYRQGAANGIDILASRSTDEGATWTPATRLNDDPPGLVRDQMFPAVTAAPDGRLSALWLDRRDDPANRLYHAYARTSTDGGVTWAASVRVSGAPSDPNVAIPPGADGIGDYIGLAAGPGVVWASWVDTRNANQDIYAARERFTPQPTPTVTPTVTLTAMPTATTCTIAFSDVSPSDYFYEAVRYLFCRGAISGYADGTFRPYAYTTRGQLTKIIVLARGWPLYAPPTPSFSDVPATHPFYAYVETAHSRGVVSGYADGTFRPGNNVTRGQLCKIVTLALGWPIYTPPVPSFSDVPATHPFYGYIETARGHGVVSGYADRTFRPGGGATRGQVAKVVYGAGRWYTTPPNPITTHRRGVTP